MNSAHGVGVSPSVFSRILLFDIDGTLLLSGRAGYRALTRAFERAPALLDVLVTRDAISPDASSGLPSVPDLQPLSSWDDAEKVRFDKTR